MWIFVKIILILFLTGVESSIIALKQFNLDRLEKMAIDVSNPNSNNYGNYLSHEEINQLVSPPLKQINMVKKWLYKNGGTNIVVVGDAIIVDNLDKNFWENIVLPTEINHLIDFIEYSKNNKIKKPRQKKNISSNVDNGYAGKEALYSLYNIENKSVDKTVSVGLIAFDGSMGFSEDDLKYSEKQNFEIKNPVSNIIGQNQGSDVESQLDVQMASLIANNASIWYWRVEILVIFFCSSIHG